MNKTLTRALFTVALAASALFAMQNGAVTHQSPCTGPGCIYKGDSDTEDHLNKGDSNIKDDLNKGDDAKDNLNKGDEAKDDLGKDGDAKDNLGAGIL